MQWTAAFVFQMDAISEPLASDSRTKLFLINRGSAGRSALPERQR